MQVEGLEPPGLLFYRQRQTADQYLLGAVTERPVDRSPAVSFDNCAEAYDAGRSHIPSSDPDYAPKLDRDKDGIACDDPPPDFQAAPKPGATSTQATVGTQDELPKTGPAAELGIVGGGVLLLGLAAALIARRRRSRFVA